MMEQRKALKKSIVLLSGDVGHRRRRDNPKRLHDLVQERAGLTAAEIARELNISIPYVYALVSKDDEIERDEVGAHFIA
jgi:NADH:ubiquinone oxidoreductase subunit E